MNINNLKAFSILSIVWSIVWMIIGMYILDISLNGDHARNIVILMPLVFILWFVGLFTGHKLIKIMLGKLSKEENNGDS